MILALIKYLNKSYIAHGEPVEPPFDELSASGFLSVHAQPDEARQAQCVRKYKQTYVSVLIINADYLVKINPKL